MNKKIEELLSRAVEQVIDKKELSKKLLSGKKLRIKLGIDPTADTLHLGNAVVLWKLREFQELGHRALLIIGDFTARLGDPSNKGALRKVLSEAQIKKNMRSYLEQASKILDLKKTEVCYNREWLKKLELGDFIQLAQLATVNQLLERDIFKKRRAERRPVFLHEILYPVLQAYDSVAVKADVELGGTDQTFNLLFGRSLMGKMGLQPQEILTCPLLIGLDGKLKMSKSLGNFIGILETPGEMYGKMMSLPDTLILPYFELAARADKTALHQMVKRLKKENPRDLKMEVAKRVIALYHGSKRALQAQEEFVRVFQKKELPREIPGFTASNHLVPIVGLLRDAGFAGSNSEAARLVKQRGVRVNRKLILDPTAVVAVTKGTLVMLGKRRLKQVRRVLS